MGVQYNQLVVCGWQLSFGEIDYSEIPNEYTRPDSGDLGIVYDGRSEGLAILGKVIERCEEPSAMFSEVWDSESVTLNYEETMELLELAGEMNLETDGKPSMMVFTVVA